MEWMVLNPQIHTMFSGLGSYYGDTYVINPDCLMTLGEIWRRLSLEDRTLRTFRRAIALSQVVKKDLLPLLVNSKSDKKITALNIKILANLTMPVECLLPIEVMSKTEAGRSTIYELSVFLSSCKEAFLDSRTTRRFLEHLRNILVQGELQNEEYEVVNDCVVLLRNILHIPEYTVTSYNCTSLQNQLLWNLFAQNIDKVMMELLNSHHMSQWVLAVVQVVALMYREQHVASLQKLLNLWFEASLSESSEDNESNTSPPERDSGDSSSSMATSDPTSDSSDNNGGTGSREKEARSKGTSGPSKKVQSNGPRTKQAKAHPPPQPFQPPEKQQPKECQSSEVSDCGYGTQVENQESNSTSSNDDEAPNRCTKPVHQKPSNMIQKTRYPSNKPHTPQEKQELQKKKLIRRSRLNSVKALLHHTPTDEDISHLLKEFTVDFLLKGYSSLVSELLRQLLFNKQAKAYMDSSHFFWLITYFLKFAAQLELDLEHISSVLSVDVLYYLIFEGVNLTEQFEMAKDQADNELAPCTRRLHLVVIAVREMIQAVESYKKMPHLNDREQHHLNDLQRKICESEDIRRLFVLLLRQFSPTIQSRQYLQDVIVTNHIVLSYIENSQEPGSTPLISQHINQFISVEIMSQYGLLLECFQENGQYVNDCIFTMMHHVAGDLDQVAALFQPPILKTFSQIWESNFQICDDWSDLIEFVIHKFINLPARSMPSGLTDCRPEEGETRPHLPTQQPRPPGWSEEDCHNLYWYFVQSSSCSDPVGAVIQLYSENGINNKTRIGVIEKLLQQDIINTLQYRELLEKEHISITKSVEKTTENSRVQTQDEIDTLKEHLEKNNKSEYLVWIQRSLLEACHAKLSFYRKSSRVIEPIPYYYTLVGEPIPVVAWSSEQSAAMTCQPFLLLLHKLNLHLPADSGKPFARIPHFLTPESMLAMARRLGPLNQSWMKFEADEIGLKPEQSQTQVMSESSEDNMVFASAGQHAPPYIPYTPEPTMSHKWMEITPH